MISAAVIWDASPPAAEACRAAALVLQECRAGALPRVGLKARSRLVLLHFLGGLISGRQGSRKPNRTCPKATSVTGGTFPTRAAALFQFLFCFRRKRHLTRAPPLPPRPPTSLKTELGGVPGRPAPEEGQRGWWERPVSLGLSPGSPARPSLRDEPVSLPCADPGQRLPASLGPRSLHPATGEPSGLSAVPLERVSAFVPVLLAAPVPPRKAALTPCPGLRWATWGRVAFPVAGPGRPPASPERTRNGSGTRTTPESCSLGI